MMRMTIFAVSMMLLAAPAAASQSAKPGAAASNGAAPSVVQERKYCIQYDDFTGSRVGAKQECKTKAQWARQGVHVDKLGKD